MIKILFDSQTKKYHPKITFVLIDWSIRESFHTIDYLNNQNINRESYELIWIEYYDKQSLQIKNKIEDAKRKNKRSPVDKWVVMNMPQSIHYHKHLMYNIGIALSCGEIIAIMDSDAIVVPTFVEYILNVFDINNKTVLHFDEIRNNSQRFYPFNYPSIEDILGEGCINWKNGKTTGLLSEIDTIHTRNYGACMVAPKESIIKIGGADEHIDFLGRICGPYDMTFRLLNIGLREYWSFEHFLYHVWHPGVTEDSYVDYIGPNDSRNISTTALESLVSKRTLPLVENKIINKIRNGNLDNYDMGIIIDKEYFSLWNKNRAEIKTGTKVIKSAAMIETGYKGFNIIGWQRKVYAISQEVGPINFAEITEDVLKEYQKNNKCFVAESCEEVKHLVDAAPVCYSVPCLIEEGYNDFNILCYKDKYYAVAQSLGPIDFTTADLKIYEDSLQFAVGESIDEAMRFVDKLIIFKTEISGRDSRIEALQREITERDSAIERQRKEIEEKEAGIVKLQTEISGRDLRIEALQRELTHIKTSLWFRLYKKVKRSDH